MDPRPQAPDSTKPKTVVVNVWHEPFDVYIGRTGFGFEGKFGNPYKIWKDGTRDEIVEKFRRYFYKRISIDPQYHQAILELKGKRLGCFCPPRRCHGDIIVGYLEGTHNISAS